MAKADVGPTTLLRWTKHVLTSDVQDPLGTSLRGGTRLTGRLLHCITSITPRARYFSFVPWCVLDHQRQAQRTGVAAGLRRAMILREHALTLGCVAHHEGEAYPGGSLVGSRSATKWLSGRRSDEADLGRLNFVKNPAYNAYFASLVNLGVFVTDEEAAEADDVEEEAAEQTFDDLRLSPMGEVLARKYAAAVEGLQAVRDIASPGRRSSIEALRRFGQRGGLSELSHPTAPDRGLLQDLFFRRVELKGESHRIRRQSLLLLLALCRELRHHGVSLDRSRFAGAVYFGEVLDGDESRREVALPPPLIDVARRWRMYYFHYYMAAALEGLFSWLVTDLGDAGLRGRTLEQVVGSLQDRTVAADLRTVLDRAIPASVDAVSPARLFSVLGVPDHPLDADVSGRLDTLVRLDSPSAEPHLDEVLRERTYLRSPAGLAVPLVLLAATLGRYERWRGTEYGHWLASASEDPYVDLVPTVLSDGLERRLGDWWRAPLSTLASAVLQRYVVQQHQSMSYEKTAAGDRCLLVVDGPSLRSTGKYEKIGIVNARFNSAMQVLADLGLMLWDEEDGGARLTPEGDAFLDGELEREGRP